MLEANRPALADESRGASLGTGGFTAPRRSHRARKKRGLLGRIGIVPPAIGLAALLVAVVYFAANMMMSPSKSGANGMADFIDGLGNSGSAALLVQERQNIIDMSAAAKTMTVASKPVAVNAAQMLDPSTSSAGSGGGTVSAPPAPANPTGAEQIGKAMLPSFGFNQTTQWDCLYNLWMHESGWNVYAENASGAYGIPQALPGSKMASAGSDWQTNPATQIKWGLGYISQIYGTPCGAWSHEETYNFY